MAEKNDGRGTSERGLSAGPRVDALIASARKAREKAYAPYSGFKVGAAIEGADGRVFTGVNVENASYGLTCCAERTAVFKAVSEGCTEFTSIAIVAGEDEPASPCGACRQVLFEFAPDADIIMEDLKGHRRVATVSQYLPDGFGPKALASGPRARATGLKARASESRKPEDEK